MEIASFKVDFDTTDAQNNVDALADATTRALNQMEDETQQSLTASGADMERLADIFRASGNIIESAINALIDKEEELARQTNDTAEEGSKFREVFSTIGAGLAAAGTAVAATVPAIGALVQTTTAAITVPHRDRCHSGQNHHGHAADHHGDQGAGQSRHHRRQRGDRRHQSHGGGDRQGTAAGQGAEESL